MGEIGPGEDDLKYTGKDRDPDTGLFYFNARWYDSAIGRFTSEDPIRDGWNWYGYANANPLRFTDPTGLRPIEELDFDPGQLENQTSQEGSERDESLATRPDPVSRAADEIGAQIADLQRQASELDPRAPDFESQLVSFQQQIIGLFEEYNQAAVDAAGFAIGDYVENGLVTSGFGVQQALTGDYRSNFHAGTDAVGGYAKSPFYTRFRYADFGDSNALGLEIIGTDLVLQILHGDESSFRMTGGLYAPGQEIMPFPTKNNSPETSTGPHFDFRISDGSRFYDILTMEPADIVFSYSKDGGATWRNVNTDLSYGFW